MTTYFQKSYGGFVYTDGSDFATFTENIGYRQRISKVLQRDGAFSAGALHDPRRVTIQGVLLPNSGAVDQASFRNSRDAFAAAHAAGAAKPLYIDNDRYLNAEVENVTFGEWHGLPNFPFSVSFLCFDVYWYASSSNLLSLTTAGAGNTISTGGTATALPIFTLAVTAAPAGGLITLTNAAGDTCKLAPTATGTYVVDSTQESITLAGVDSTNILTGAFLTLAKTTDSLSVTLTGGVTLSSATVGWQSRWY